MLISSIDWFHKLPDRDREEESRARNCREEFREEESSARNRREESRATNLIHKRLDRIVDLPARMNERLDSVKKSEFRLSEGEESDENRKKTGSN